MQEVEPLLLWRPADLELLNCKVWAQESALGGNPACHAPEMVLSLEKPGKRLHDRGLLKLGTTGHLGPQGQILLSQDTMLRLQ